MVVGTFPDDKRGGRVLRPIPAVHAPVTAVTESIPFNMKAWARSIIYLRSVRENKE
jgi:hypothetical protein